MNRNKLIGLLTDARVKKLAFGGAMAWTVLLALSLCWNWFQVKASMVQLFWVHMALWLIGMAAIAFGAQRIDRNQSGQHAAEVALHKALADLEAKFDTRTSELKRANEALQESTLQLQTAARAANVGLWDWDVRTNRVLYSNEWKHQIGYEDDEITNDFNEWQARVHPDDLEHTLLMLRNCVEGASADYKTEFRLRHKDGSYRWVMVLGAALRDDTGNTFRMLGAHVDITDRKDAEERVRRSEAHLAEAQRVARVGSWELNPATGHGTWSEEMFRITGFDSSQKAPTLAKFIEMQNPELRSMLTGLIERIETTGQPEQVEFSSDPARVPVVHYAASVEAVPDEQGKTVKLVGTLQDISERIRATEALNVEKKKFQALIDESPHAVALIDENQCFGYLNPGFEAIFGYTIEEIPTRNDWFERAYPEPTYRNKVMASWRQAEAQANPGTIRNQIWQVRCKDGSDKWVQISTAFLATGEKIVTYEDVSERHYMEERLRQAQKMEAIGTLAGGIAHDFNNILTAILGYAELAKEETPADSAPAKYTSQVIEAGLRARNLVQHILDFSRQSTPKKAPLSLHLVVKETLSLLRATIPATISIHQEILPSGMIEGDPNQMHQVVMNLCTNACQAMQMKKGELAVCLKSITLEAEDVSHYPELKPDHYLQLSVSDTGCGMSPEIVQKIFDPYFTTKPQGEGTGLGLSVIHGIVKNHGGTIIVYSEPDKGSTFQVFLPMMESIQTIEKDMPKQPLPTGSEHLLFVDDEPALTELGKKILSSLGYQVETRTAGSEALAMLEEQPGSFDLLITDMTMPHMSGVELAEEALRIRPDLPIILCTGFSHIITEPRAKALGIRQLVMKPVIRKEMAVLVRKVLDEKETKEV